MRTLMLALVGAGLMTAAVATGASAADPASPKAAATTQQAQYYPYPYRYWDYPPYWRHHYHWRPWWRYSEAEELNRQELQRLGIAP